MATIQIEVSDDQLEEMVKQLKRDYDIVEVTNPALCMQLLLQQCADQASWFVDMLGDSVIDEILETKQAKECLILGEYEI